MEYPMTKNMCHHEALQSRCTTKAHCSTHVATIYIGRMAKRSRPDLQVMLLAVHEQCSIRAKTQWKPLLIWVMACITFSLVASTHGVEVSKLINVLCPGQAVESCKHACDCCTHAQGCQESVCAC